MAKFKAALFDLDGTLLNTENFIFESFKHVLLTHHQRDIAWKEVRPLIGISLADSYDILGYSDTKDKLALEHHLFQEKNFHLTSVYPYVKEVLETLSKAKIKMAIVTTRSGNAKPIMELGKIFHYFDVLITADDVKNLKPHPEPLLKALEKLNVKTKDAVMIGDTDHDIKAGKAAGIKTIGILYGFGADKLLASNPDYTVGDIREIEKIIL